MMANNFQHHVRCAAIQRIRAKTNHPVLWKGSMDFGLIPYEVRPIPFIHPGRIPTSPKSLVTGVERSLFLFRPLSEYPIRIEVSAAQVPVAVIPNLHLPRIEIPIYVRRCLSQSDLESFYARWIRRHPKAEFVMF